ncbi:MAG TPA: hypothetical protein V6D50_25005 [Chroococcales cyanobacterium]
MKSANQESLEFGWAASFTVCPKSMLDITWKVELCPKCRQIAVKSQDEFFGCLKCRKLPQDQMSQSPQRGCVYCGQPLIILMEACLTCGNQPIH